MLMSYNYASAMLRDLNDRSLTSTTTPNNTSKASHHYLLSPSFMRRKIQQNNKNTNINHQYNITNNNTSPLSRLNTTRSALRNALTNSCVNYDNNNQTQQQFVNL